MSARDDRFEAQLAYLRSDDRIRERATEAARLSSEERLRQVYALCRAAAKMAARLPDDARARTERHRQAHAPGAERILLRLARLARP